MAGQRGGGLSGGALCRPASNALPPLAPARFPLAPVPLPPARAGAGTITAAHPTQPPAPPSAQIGNTTDGGYGLGWKNDTGDTDEYPFDDALAQKLANEVRGGGAGAAGWAAHRRSPPAALRGPALAGAGLGRSGCRRVARRCWPRTPSTHRAPAVGPSPRPCPPAHTHTPATPPHPTPHPAPPTPTTPIPPHQVLDDKIEEEEDRQAVLGKDILNPTTGLTLVDYLEGREGRHNELLFKRYGLLPGPGERDADTYIDSEVGRGGGEGAGAGAGPVGS
jgi:hypothetical protein